MKIRTAASATAALCVTVGLFASPASYARTAALIPEVGAAVPEAIQPRTATAEQCQIWAYNYESDNNANQRIVDEVCWTADPPGVRVMNKLVGWNDLDPYSYCTLTPEQPACAIDTKVHDASFRADFANKQVIEISKYAPLTGRWVREQHIYSFQ
ncbi:hypothetical protein [Microtetraspora fusca]|uniref:hypothetical protein n=1 Tax=Microtetraspora fusca TaxID=1997 RepID=UPI0008379112|nr:hypothetical protein [Microtetraspora fusca]